GALHLEGAQLVEDDLDLVRDPRQPPGLAGEDEVLLLLRLEQQEVQQLLLPPEQRRQVLVVHVRTAFPWGPAEQSVAAPWAFPSSCHRHGRKGGQAETRRRRPGRGSFLLRAVRWGPSSAHRPRPHARSR